MNKKLLLSTVFMLMSWQGIFAGAPEFSGTPEGQLKPRVAMTAQPQGLLMGNMVLDTMGPLLKNLPFKDGWKLLSVNQFHRNHGEVWEIFRGIHGISLTKDEDTAEKIRGKIIAQSQETLLAAVPSEYDSLTPDIMINLLENAQEKPFLWGGLVDTLQKKIYIGDEVPPSWWAQFGSVCSLEDEKAFNGHAEAGSRMFEGVSVPLRIVFLETVAKKVCPSDDTWPAPGARDAQGRLIDAAIEGRGLLKEISREKRLAYLENAAEYKNPKRQSTPYAQNVQKRLIMAANGGEGVFAGISREECLAYVEKVTEYKNPRGEPTSYARNAQNILISAVDRGEGVFAGISREERLAYLENAAKSRDSEGESTPYARNAHAKLISSAYRGEGVFAGISREERLAYVKKKSEQGILCGMFAEEALKNLQ